MHSGIIPATSFGTHVRQRLTDDQVIWFVTVGADQTPQPNPIWFVGEDDSVLVYSWPHAHRVTHIRHRPRVSLHFDGNGRGGDIVVLHGTAHVVDDVPSPDRHPVYRDKYADGMRTVSGSAEGFAATYSLPIRVTLHRVRGF